MTYYIKQDNEIVLYSDDIERMQSTIAHYPNPDEIEILETEENQVIVDAKLVSADEAQRQLAQKEQERVNNLTMTALDFITFMQRCGLTLEQINTYLEANLSIKMQLTYCQNVYCGVVKSLLPITIGNATLTVEMVERAFKIKNGEIEND